MRIGAPVIPRGLVRVQPIRYEMGLNTEDPQMEMRPGEMVDGKNFYVAVRAGYTVFDGYERFDGQPAPSDSSYWLLPFDTGSEELVIGTRIMGSASLAEGVVFLDTTLDSGTYGGGDAAGTLYLTNVTGTFQNGENIQVSSVTKARVSGTADEKPADTQDEYDERIQAAIEYNRSVIEKVPGDGPVRGVWLFRGNVYAFRDDSEVAKMYVATTTGWDQVDLGSHIAFYEAGTAHFQENWTLTGDSSSATATIKRVAIYTGSYAASTARGLLALSDVTGTFTAKEDVDISYADIATADGTESSGDLDFDDGGEGTIAVGHLITGGTSGATGTITAVVVKTGSWEDGNAAGTITMSGVSGTFQDDEALNASVAGMAKVEAHARDNALGTAGKYEFINTNFRATDRTYRMYGVNGTGLAFEFDGTVFCPIKTQGKEDDFPNHISRHSFYILLSFADGRCANSALGEPLVFNAINGSLEIGVGDQVTGLVSQNKSATVIYSRNRIHILTGATTSEFVLDSYDDSAGAQEWSCQRVGIPWAFDDRGISSIAATDVYGNFAHATLSEKIREFIEEKSGLVSCSMRIRSRGQYRLFFSDLSGLSLTFWRDQVRGIVPFELKHQAFCACAEEDEDGRERLFFGGEDGYVYEMDKGTSFDEQEREAFCVLNHSDYGFPGNKKQFKVAHIKVKSQGKSSVQVGAVYTYEAVDVPQQDVVEGTVYGGAGRWDNVNWNEFNWSAPFIGRLRRKLGHSGETCALVFYSSGMYDDSYTLEGHVMHFNVRNRLR